MYDKYEIDLSIPSQSLRVRGSVAMFVLFMIATIVGGIALMGVMGFLMYRIYRSEKNIIAWLTLVMLAFFMVITVKEWVGFVF